jgi:hypothetical protein
MGAAYPPNGKVIPVIIKAAPTWDSSDQVDFHLGGAFAKERGALQ